MQFEAIRKPEQSIVTPKHAAHAGKPPLHPTGILFGMAANLLLVTIADIVVSRFGWPPAYETLATVGAPLVAGILTALYMPARGGMHAFVGSLLSLPIIAIVIFQGVWPPAVLAAAFCTLGAALTEILLRRRVKI